MALAIPKTAGVKARVESIDIPTQMESVDIAPQGHKVQVASVDMPADNGGQPPAEEVNSAGRTPAEEAAFAEQIKAQDRPVEPGTLQADDMLAAGSLGKMAARLLGKAGTTVAEKMLPRLGAEGLTEIRHMQAAVKAGTLAPEEFAAHARKLLGGQEAPVWTKATAEGQQYAKRLADAGQQGVKNRATQALVDSGELSNGFGNYAGKAPQDPFAAAANATNATPGKRLPSPENPVVQQFTNEATNWLADFSRNFTKGF